jgi:[acyl-carrier-protein] S-malonyltransferase
MNQSQLAFVFPGQGSQSVAMLEDFTEEAIVKQTFEEASDQLSYDLWQLVSQGPQESLNQTQKTQPALLTASIALWRLWNENNGLAPNFVAGHSLGEYSALVAANVLDFATTVKLVELRGQLMQAAVTEGSGKMAAIIGLDDDTIQKLCEQAAEGEVVSPVNYNSPGQVVIAGQASAVERAMHLCKDAGAKRALPLPVSVPSHCSLMQPAADELKQTLETIKFHAPAIKLVNNVDVAVTEDPDEIKQALVRQLYSPVRWTESVTYMAAQGVTHLIECGPGKVLSGLAKRIERSMSASQLLTKNAFNQSLEVTS